MSVLVSNFINGRMVESHSGRNADLFNPANGELRGQVQLSSASEALEAVAVAKQAQEAWQATPPLQRARVMFRFKALLEENADELATLISTEHGKVHSDALGELTRGLEVVEFSCGIPHLLKGEHSLNVGREIDSYSLMQPVGVCVGITPFNFPVMVPLWMIPVALACGNSFILKPSEKDPSASLKLAELLKQAGLPDGVFNVVQGDKEVVDALLESPDVAAVSFVGSTPIAEAIYSKGSANGKRVQALGGAKNHLVVMPDADLEGATNAIMGAAYGAAGERCMAISVAVAVGDETADRLVAQLKQKVEALRVGPGLGVSPENEMGPLVSEPHMNKVTEYIQSGVDQGATLVVDGRGINTSAPGYFVGGTLFDNVTPDMTIYNEEIFGPVLSVVRAKDYQEALQLINEHEFGNGTAIFTRDGDTARDFSEKVEIGMVGVNVPIPVPMAFHSFGGWKRSIFGPLNVHGNDGVRFYTRMKTVTARWPKGQRESEFVMPTMK
ncbi:MULTISPECIES: CoA-acylating methylmalonate-semialdehyde dehydrogenase [Vibrio]|uniref:methylmalonate-semialdehyde dehydrogenase (CoA acylating) n=1 Tax=Vibrio mediterranei TaxID=689 RepID=A0A3G4VLD7_9VIBR|nr:MULTISPECIES: CoA-acylating methylmalonate-semialdehyde dehydrogenase [Vibrio]AYV24818.1 CoA-acylating methylmalonate-semialdehyde dehydrogenase [Vibrio mediterranei]MCF4174189.1 CoA-acylating methylmalonate-semialdehyde dehydrogenase [Vibrio sp. McD22-P3]MCY9854701.1 CoA-acylating methylmalonate-semialdehyde dehydrogenase [Vibrio mediterranei]NOI24048.1 CoA-acylating methylmalonate-semialdehyde dehydrogenase [Vibrio mediterranei]NUW75226.1 CoA-acylating methylmalonate-semialdehyde dehydrog